MYRRCWIPLKLKEPNIEFYTNVMISSLEQWCSLFQETLREAMIHGL